MSSCSGAPEALRNVVAYRLRKTFPPLLLTSAAPEPASLSGVVADEQGLPIPGAIALVSTARGQVFTGRSDSAGRFTIDGVAPGRYVPMAAAWGYQESTAPAVRVDAGRQLTGLDFTLPHYQPERVTPTNLTIGPPEEAHSQFPEPMIATRYPFTFTLDGLTIQGGRMYLPADPPAQPRPTMLIIYPSAPMNWDAASVALTRDGNRVLAVGPDGDRGLDIEGHVRDFRAALQLWQDGALMLVGAPGDDWVVMSGSFGSLILFRALRDLPEMPPAIVDVGGVSDAFLGVQALYSEDLAIPAPYDTAVAALGSPDRDPAFFFAYSPVFFAERLPPTFVIHTYNDEVIPYNQAEAMAAALDEAGIPHQLLLYRDTTHYLDAYNPTPGTGMVYERVLRYAQEVAGGSP